MAGTVTLTEESHHPLTKIKWAWVSDASGDADQASSPVAGEVISLTTIPDSGGTQPTDQYDITITDGDSVDVMQATAANRSNASTEHVAPTAAIGVNGALTLNVAAAGNAKGGTAVLWIRTA